MQLLRALAVCVLASASALRLDGAEQGAAQGSLLTPRRAAHLHRTPLDSRAQSIGAGAQRSQRALLWLRGGEGSLTSWFQGLLAKLGIFSKKGKLIVIGLDNAGKSTLLSMLLRNKVMPHEPTHQPVTDEVRIGYLKLRAVDMGGHTIARRMWKQYSQEADAVVFLVDAADTERFQEAALELHKLLIGNALPPQAPVLVLGNKCDLPSAVRKEELYYSLGLDQLAAAGPGAAPPRPIELYMCSVYEGVGFPEGLEWLGKCIK